MIELPSVSVVLAAFIHGIVLGMHFSTNFENEIRRIRKPLIAIFRTDSFFGYIANQMLWFCIVFYAMTVAAVAIMRKGGAYPLSEIDGFTFVIVWFLSAACAKYLRFRYWKKKSEKL